MDEAAPLHRRHSSLHGPEDGRRRLDVLLFLTLGFAAFLASFYRLDYPDMQMWDESENAVVILETLDADRFFVLLRQGEPYFDKPHLWYYLTALAVRIGGVNELSFRVVSATAGFLLVICAFWASKAFFTPLAGFAAGVFMLAVRHLYIPRPAERFSTHHVRSGDSDVLMILFIFAAFWSFYHVERRGAIALYLGAIFSGLAVLTKGPLGLTPILTFLLFRWLSPNRAILAMRKYVIALLLFLAVTVPWQAAMYAQFGSVFMDRYPQYVLVRAAEGLEGHRPPWFYYFPLLADKRVFFGLELVLLAALAALLDRKKLFSYPRAVTLLTLGLMLGALTLAKTKIAWYILPLYPFCAVLVASLVEQLQFAAGKAGLSMKGKAGVVSAIAGIFSLMSLFAAYNLYTITHLQRGPRQRLFAQARSLCGESLVYSDAVTSHYIEYHLRRHGVKVEPPADSSCFLALAETPLPAQLAASFEEHRRRAEFVLYRRKISQPPEAHSSATGEGERDGVRR